MLKKIGLPLVALVGMLVLFSPPPAEAEVRFGVFLGAPAPVYRYAAPAYPVYPGAAYYGNGYYPYYPGAAYVAPPYVYNYGYRGGYYPRYDSRRDFRGGDRRGGWGRSDHHRR